MSRYLLALVLSLAVTHSYAQTDADAAGVKPKPGNILPAEEAVLNYRQAGFSVPVNAKAVKYLFEVVQDSFVKESAFDSKVIIKESVTKNRAVILLPAFGSNYTWRVTYLDAKNKKTGNTKLYHFKTGTNKTVDTTKYHLRIIDSAADHKDLTVMLDLALIMYDMNGNPVWYMPELPIIAERNQQLRDFKPTEDGTFTALTNVGAHEFDYDGNVLWSAPNDGKVSGDSSEYYHHEFTKLSNGHYMVAGEETSWKKIPGDRNLFVKEGDPLVAKKEDSQYYKRVKCGTLIEYDKDGKVIWSWKTSEHFDNKVFFRRRNDNGFLFHSSTHLNAFDFDEKNNIIYLSYRDINKIIAIAYPSGKIIRSYGEKINEDMTVSQSSPFYGQHCCRLDRKTGNLYVYNNNFAGIKKGMLDPNAKRLLNVISHISFFKQINNYADSIENIWDFSCDIDTFAISGAGSGGSVALLDDGCVFVSMGAANRLFIVNPGKKVIWNVLPEISDDNHKWSPLGQYRANYIKKEDIEKYIFFKPDKK